jgi:L-threonylcarbamoyladenylate synthase
VNELSKAASILKGGGVVAHATEGVWGLTCDPWSIESICRVLEIKNRQKDKGLILLGESSDFFISELSGTNPTKRQEIEKSWPGHHTWILPNIAGYTEWVTGGRETVACRVPAHEQARELSKVFGKPIVSTSANLSGSEELRLEGEVRALFKNLVDFVLPGAVGNAGGPSTIHNIDGSLVRG